MDNSLWERIRTLLLYTFVLPFVWLLTFLHEHSDTILYYVLNAFRLVAHVGSRVERLLHFAGRITINALLAVGLFMLFYRVSVETGYPQPALEPSFNLVMRIFDTKLIWVIPLVFGATLGILHLWKLQLDQKRYWEEQRERWKKERETEDARRAEQTKARATLSPIYSQPRPRSVRQEE